MISKGGQAKTAVHLDGTEKLAVLRADKPAGRARGLLGRPKIDAQDAVLPLEGRDNMTSHRTSMLEITLAVRGK